MTAQHHRTFRFATAAGLAGALLTGFAPPAGPAGLAGPAGPAATAPGPSEAQLALRKAAATGIPVELTGRRTAYTTTYANPDGATFRLDKSAVPVRAKNAAGAWVKADPTLVVRKDGTVGPKGSALGLAFSNGGPGAGMLKVTTERGETLSLAWPAKLPKPALAGDTATYADALPGVDLRLTAGTDSIRYGLVVKTPQAAGTSAVKRIRLALATNLLRVFGAGRHWSAQDPNGNARLSAPAAQMWDSSGPGAASDGSQYAGPADGDKLRFAATEVADGALVLVPDAGLLAQRAASAYPLHVTGEIAPPGQTRVHLRSDGYRSYFWDNGLGRRGKGAGTAAGRQEKLYFQFKADGLRGLEILDARFKVTRAWAAQCDPRPLQLVRLSSTVGEWTSWTDLPKAIDRMGDRTAGAASGTACDKGPSSGSVTFKDNPAEPDENLTPTVRSFARGQFTRLGLELRPQDEADLTAWKSFRDNAVLSVTYLDKPDVPTAVTVVGGGAVCGVGGTPGSISDPTPTLRATAQAKSGEEYEARLGVVFRVEREQPDRSWAVVGETVLPGAPGAVGDGSVLADTVRTELTGGVVYRYTAQTLAYSTGSLVSRSDWSAGCYFTVDRTPPAAPTIRFDGPYSECTSTSCPAAGGPGK
ncbi:LamG domain protein jellyroll fold domain protein, partial [Streptomyces sp. 12297]